MTNQVIPPLPEFYIWKCPKCGHTEKFLRQRPLWPIYAFGDVLKDMFIGKEKHKCPKCGTMMVRMRRCFF